MPKITLSSPWVEFYREIEALFMDDPDVVVIFDEEEKTIDLRVSNSTKADALTQLMPESKQFGNVEVKIRVVPTNTDRELTDVELFKMAFEGNPVFSFGMTVEDVTSTPFSYIVFKKKVAQFFDDNLADIYGNKSMLFQEIAKDVFGARDGVYYCTDKEDPDFCDCHLADIYGNK